MGDKKLNWPRYSNLSLLSQPPKFRCACNFVSAWKASWWSCMLQTQSCARKALNQTQTGAGRGSWAPSYQLCPLVLSPALGSLCFFNFFFIIIIYKFGLFPLPPAPPISKGADTTSRGGQEATTVTLPIVAFILKSKGRFIAVWPSLLFLFS